MAEHTIAILVGEAPDNMSLAAPPMPYSIEGYLGEWRMARGMFRASFLTDPKTPLRFYVGVSHCPTDQELPGWKPPPQQKEPA